MVVVMVEPVVQAVAQVARVVVVLVGIPVMVATVV
jgi:hypothetical protein